MNITACIKVSKTPMEEQLNKFQYLNLLALVPYSLCIGWFQVEAGSSMDQIHHTFFPRTTGLVILLLFMVVDLPVLSSAHDLMRDLQQGDVVACE